MRDPRKVRAGCCPRVDGLERRELLAAKAGVNALGGVLTFKAQNDGVYSQQDDAAKVTLTLRTARPPAQPVSVIIDTVEGPYGGTAVAGQQYLPVHETLTFQRGNMTQTINVPIVPGAENPGKVTVALTAAAQTADAVTASTTITLDARDYVVSPKLLKWTMVTEKGRGRGIALQFNQPLDANTATDPKNYFLWSSARETGVGDWLGTFVSGGSKNAFKPVQMKIKKVEYNPDTYTVTIRPRSAMVPGGQYDVTSGRRAPKDRAPKPGSLTDGYGNRIGYFHVTVGSINQANKAGAGVADVLNKLPRW